ncbi:MAG: fused MFS/spermidine synthase [Acidobacteriota bacterium]
MILRRSFSTTSLVHLLFLLSGATALVYQVVWLRRLILVFGATAFATSTVLTAFMAGLGLGSYFFGRTADRRGDPLRLYGFLECGIGLSALAVPLLLGALVPFYGWVWNSYAPGVVLFALLKFAGSFLVLLVPTLLMGGTLPVLARWAVQSPAVVGARVGTLYAVNTLGAVGGTLLAGFLLIRVFGSAITGEIAAGMNLILGGASLALAAAAGRVGAGRRAHGALRPAAGGRRPAPARRAAVLWAYAVSGCAALLLEIAWTRVLTLLIGGSIYAFTLMLATFLAGLATGAAVFASLSDRLARGRILLLAGLMGGAGLAILLTVHLFAWLPFLFARMFQQVAGSGALMMAVKLGICIVVMFPTTLLLGGVFPVVVRLCVGDLRFLGRSVGAVYAANTAGTIVGAFAGGFVCLPLLGLQGTLQAAAAMEMALAVLFLAWCLPVRLPLRAGLVSAAVGACLLAWMGQSAWNPLLMNSGVYLYAEDLPRRFDGKVFRDFTERDYEQLFYREGATATILVAKERNNGNIFLSVNGKVDASTSGDMPTQVLSGQLPLLLHPRPRDVLIVGLASGVTTGSAATHPVRRIDVVEIEAAVVNASHSFDHVNNRPLDDSRVHVVVNDGRNYLLFTSKAYDVIISEPSNPWLSGAANLFTREYFDLVARHLLPGGISCQWIQVYNLALIDLRSLLATYSSVYPHVLAFSPGNSDLLLLGSQAPLKFDLQRLGERMRDLDRAVDLGRVGIRTPEDLLARLVLGTGEVKDLARDAPLNTDDNARIELSAPWFVHAHTLEENTRALERLKPEVVSYLAHPPAEAEGKARFALRLASAYYRQRAYKGALEAVNHSLDLQFREEAWRLKSAVEERLRVRAGD